MNSVDFNSPAGGVLGPGPSHIETISGRFVDVMNPTPHEIEADDIAHGLALTCRYGGQIKSFYSVAEHSVLVHDLLGWMGVDSDLRLAGLLHDAAEAYLGDVVAPLKWALRQAEGENAYDAMSDRLDESVAAQFGLLTERFHSPLVKQADLWALKIEAERLTTTAGAGWSWSAELPNGGELPKGISFLCGLQWHAAKRLFLLTLGDAVWAVEQDREGTNMEVLG